LTPNATSSGTEAGGVRLLISNLKYDVNENDLRALFSEFGSITNVQIKYDRSGRSLGEAEVTFSRKADAVTAQKARNGDKIDGQPMDIVLLVVNGANSNSNNPSFFVKRRGYDETSNRRPRRGSSFSSHVL